MSKSIKIFLIVLLSIVAVSVVSIMILLLTGNISFNKLTFGINTGVSEKLVYADEFELKDVNIKVDMAEVEIKESTSEKAKLEIYSEYNRYNVNDNNILDINVKSKKCYFLCINIKKSKVVLYLPVSYNQNLTIDSDYGDIKIEDFEKMKLVVNSDFGDITVGSVYDIKVDADYGDIKIDTVNNYLNISEDFGDIKIDKVTLNRNSKITSNFENVRINKTNRIYIDAQTGEVTGDLYNDKSKTNKKPTKRLTTKDLEKLTTNSDKAKTEREKTNNSESKKEEKTKSKSQKTNENTENIDENKETEEEERKRYIVIALIVLAIAILLFIFSQILKPNHDPNKPNPQNTSITAQQKPKYTPPPKDKVEKVKIEKETPEKFVDSIIKKLITQKYNEINELMSKNPDEMMEIEDGYTNITSMFKDVGQLEDYYSKTTSIFPEKTTKIFGKTKEQKDVVENNLPDGSAIPSVIKEQAKEENNLVSVSTSYIETYKESNSDDNSAEKKDRTILIFTLSTEDNKTKIKSVHRKYETVDESAISQIIEKESNSYSEISQKQPEEKKEEQKQKEENNNSNENIQQPKKEVEIPVSQKPHINLIPKGSTYVEDETPKQEEKHIKKESIQQVETEPAINQTNSATTPTNTTSSSSEGSDFGSAGGSVQ